MIGLGILASGSPLDHVLPHTLFSIGGFPITNQLFMGIFAALMVLVCFAHTASRVRVRGTGIDAYLTRGIGANLLETMCVFVREEVARPNLKHLTDKYIYYLWTVFFFILFCNLLGLIPFGPIAQVVAGLGGADDHTRQWLGHWGGTATGNLSLNLPLALVAFFMINFVAIREIGFLAYIAHFNPLGWSDLKMLPMGLMVFVLEIMGLIIKSTVLAMRLFGTMMAGHLVIAVFVSLIPVAGFAMLGVGIPVILGGVALMILELFIAMLQAFIFTFLTTLFIAAGAVHEHEEGHEAHSGHAETKPAH